jgi:hypothetical protein
VLSVGPFLASVDREPGVEAFLAVLLSAQNVVVASLLERGSAYRVEIPGDQIAELCKRHQARKLVIGRTHGAQTRSRPTDEDVVSAADLCRVFERQGVRIVDDLVMCFAAGAVEFKSVHNTTRFKQMMKAY